MPYSSDLDKSFQVGTFMPFVYIDFTLCAIDPWKDRQVIKEDLRVSDDKESIFSTLKFRNSCPNPVGHERKKGPQKQGQSSFLRTQFVRIIFKDILVYEDDLCLQTSASTVNHYETYLSRVFFSALVHFCTGSGCLKFNLDFSDQKWTVNYKMSSI